MPRLPRLANLHTSMRPAYFIAAGCSRGGGPETVVTDPAKTLNRELGSCEVCLSGHPWAPCRTTWNKPRSPVVSNPFEQGLHHAPCTKGRAGHLFPAGRPAFLIVFQQSAVFVRRPDVCQVPHHCSRSRGLRSEPTGRRSQSAMPTDMSPARDVDKATLCPGGPVDGGRMLQGLAAGPKTA